MNKNKLSVILYSVYVFNFAQLSELLNIKNIDKMHQNIRSYHRVSTMSRTKFSIKNNKDLFNDIFIIKIEIICFNPYNRLINYLNSRTQILFQNLRNTTKQLLRRTCLMYKIVMKHTSASFCTNSQQRL